MPRTNKPAEAASDSPKTARRSSSGGNGSSGESFNSDDAIAKRAYEIYLNRGGQHGADLDDWLEAERQLRPGASDVTGPVPGRTKKRKGASEGTGM